MGKGKSRRSKEGDSLSAVAGKRADDPSGAAGAPAAFASSEGFSLLSSPLLARRGIFHWCLQEHQGILWVVVCCLIGSFLGFGIGSGLFTGEFGKEPNTWRMTLGSRVRVSSLYQVLTLEQKPWEPIFGIFDGRGQNKREDLSIKSPGGVSKSAGRAVVTVDPQVLRSDPSHPTVYAVLREAVVREKGGFVHPDLGILQPAPSGAARGIGMVRDSWHQCQSKCFPGIRSEKLALKRNETDSDSDMNRKKFYKQEEVLIKVPLSFQMTRAVALQTLLPRISAEVQRKAGIHELDDAALLTLLLAHERGVGKYSRWLPYIASLPLEPSCGYSKALRPYFLDSILALKEELGLDVNGWSGELLKATKYAEKIAASLARDYGSFLQHPKGMGATDNIQWALCQVASRATAGSHAHGTLRMVPLADMINHDANAGGFVEVVGEEKLEFTNDFLDATLEDSGAFVVRSLRHGQRKALKVGQELLVNYNVPHFSALDWFISQGFVPPERWIKWQKMDAALPRVRRDGPFGTPEAGRRNAP